MTIPALARTSPDGVAAISVARLAASAAALVGVLAACGEVPDAGASDLADAGTGPGSPLVVPAGFPEPRVPDDNPVTAEKADLGRYLFYDVRLSANGTQSCGSCHLQELAFTDGLTTAIGSTGEHHPRNSSGLTNAAYNATYTWANPVLTTLEKQILVPIFGESPIELGAGGHQDEILDRLRADAAYVDRFAAAYPESDDAIDWDHVVGALATFVRTIVSGSSPFDRYVYGRDASALSAQERRGMELFFSERLECHHCHGGFNFTESSVHAGSAVDAALFHNTGLYNVDGLGAYPANNLGVYAVTGDPADMGRFRAPTLRNVAVTAPYMHDGSIATLEDVVDFYSAGGRLIEDGPYAGDGRTSPLKSGLVPGFSISEDERADLVAFLGALTDTELLTDPRLSDPFAEP
ncbi:MAG: di-heme enzyme [Myxococcales bacterium]|nr:di-heme enzyme [Myxococcales bacterium]